MISEFWHRYQTGLLSHLHKENRYALLSVSERTKMANPVDSLGGAQESLPAIAAKVGPSVSVTLATIAGYNVSDIILWATLIYTVLMIAHKLYHIWCDIKGHGKKHGSD